MCVSLMGVPPPGTTAEGLLSPRTDIWSVGLVLLKVVTGKVCPDVGYLFPNDSFGRVQSGFHSSFE